ncbi:MAG: outer membrane protein OmpA-like peptidoglycan-associated protein [Oleispira sp.]|jgi:outer membrane protein OmpA-like peptidoglycan-associated protein
MCDVALHWFVTRLIVLTGLAFIPLKSFALQYGGGIENTEWKISGSIFECRFEQALPEYGKGVFYHQAGENIIFQLEARKNLMKAGRASISIIPAPWHPSQKSQHLGYEDLIDGKPSLELDSDRSNQFLHALLEGKQPIVTRRAYYDDSKYINIHLSAIHFKNFYSNYLACVDQLLPMNFSQIGRNKIYFGDGKEELSPKDEALLDRVIFYMNNDPRVFAIYIDGHSDNRGRRYDNRQLSKRRAESIERYFIQKGINPDIVTLRFHGQRYPIASNNTAAGRGKNRRVTVRLEQSENMEIPPELLFVLP